MSPQLLILLYDSLKPTNTSLREITESILKPVDIVSFFISAVPINNLTEPIELVFEVPETTKHLVPAYWNYSANGRFRFTFTDIHMIMSLSE